MKGIYFVNNNLKFLFSIDSKTSKPLLFNFFDNVQPCNIILPYYLKKNYVDNNLSSIKCSAFPALETSIDSKVQTIANVINKEGHGDQESEFEGFIFSSNYKDCITKLNQFVKDMHLTITINQNDLEFAKKYFNQEKRNIARIEDNINFSNIKKFAFDFFIKSDSTNQLEKFSSFLRKKRLNVKKEKDGQFVYTKLIDLGSFIQKIYFTPKISLKNLRAISHSKINFEHFLIYFQKLGLIQIQEIGEIDNRDYSIEFDKNIHLFMDII